MRPTSWIMDVAKVDVLSEENTDPIIAGELLEPKEDKVSMENVKRNGSIGWLKVGSSYSLLFEKVVSFLFNFPTT